MVIISGLWSEFCVGGREVSSNYWRGLCSQRPRLRGGDWLAQLIGAAREMPVVLAPALGKVSRSLGWGWGAGRDLGRGGRSADLGGRLACLRFDGIRAPGLDLGSGDPPASCPPAVPSAVVPARGPARPAPTLGSGLVGAAGAGLRPPPPSPVHSSADTGRGWWLSV